MPRPQTQTPWLQRATGWWCATVDHKRVYLDKDFQAACRKLAALRKGERLVPVDQQQWLSVPFAVLADEYLTDVKARRKPATYTGARFRLLRGLRVLGTSLRVGEVSKLHLARIEQALAGNCSPSTIRDTLSAVQAVFGWAVEQGLLDVTPLLRYRKPQGRQRTRVITAEEFGELLRHSDRPFRRFLIALRLTGCRPGEVRNLIWEWVDLGRGLWIFPEHKTATQQQTCPRIVPLPPTVSMMCRWLSRRPHVPADHVFLNQQGRPYTKDCVVTKMDRIRKRAGIAVKGGERIVLYSARHTFATENVGKVSDIELAQVMGHTDTRTTRRYTHLNAARLLDIGRRIQDRRRSARVDAGG